MIETIGISAVGRITDGIMRLVEHLPDPPEEEEQKTAGISGLDDDDLVGRKKLEDNKQKSFQNVLYWGAGSHTTKVEEFPIKLRDEMLIEGNDFLKSVAASRDHTIFLTSSGKLYAFGANHCSQLGIGNHFGQSTPTLLEKIKDKEMKQAACGAKHSVAVDVDGNVYSWGDLRGGRCGYRGAHGRSSYPQLINSLSRYRILSVSCGSAHTVLLRDNGTVYAFGENIHGQLGTGDIKLRHNPTQMKQMCSKFGGDTCVLDQKIKTVEAGSFHTLLLTDFGSVLQCGYTDDSHTVSNIKVPTIVKLCGKPTIKKIACGMKHSIALSEKGKAYTWGSNKHGQLGHGEDNDTRIDENTGRIWDHGRTENKIPKLRPETDDDKEEADDDKEWLDDDDEGVDDDENSIPVLVTDREIVEVAAGHVHTLLLTREGKVMSFGKGAQGQLGNGKLLSISTPQYVPKINKTILGIVAAGDQSYAIEGLAKSKLASALWNEFKVSQKKKTKLGVCVNIKMGDDLEKVYCHGVVLATRSKYFRDLIMSSEPKPVADLADKSIHELKDDDIGGGLDSQADDGMEDLGTLDDDSDGGLGGLDDSDDDDSVEEKLVRTIYLDWSMEDLLSVLEYVYTDTLVDVQSISEEAKLNLLNYADVLNFPRLTEILCDEGVPTRSKTLPSDMSRCVGAREFSDVSFLIEGEEIFAHKVILGCRSEYFRTMLFGNLMESRVKGAIPMSEEIKKVVFLALLKFLYTDELEELSLSDVVGLWGLAHQYNEKRLFTLCENTIQKSVDESNIINVLQAAIFYTAERLEGFCKTVITTEMFHVTKTDKFKTLTEETQNEILKIYNDMQSRAEFDEFLQKASGEHVMTQFYRPKPGRWGRMVRKFTGKIAKRNVILSVNEDMEMITLEWESKNHEDGAEDVQFNQIVDILPGRATDILKNVKGVDEKYLEDYCFSIISHVNLCLGVETKYMRDKWVSFLKQLVAVKNQVS